jgi:hypothetical protein
MLSLQSFQVLYHQLHPESNNSSREFGNIAFVVVSTRDDILALGGLGLEPPIRQTLNLTKITNGTISESQAVRCRLELLMFFLR